MVDHFYKKIGFLGITCSPPSMRAPESSGCADRFIDMLKVNLLWVQTFETSEDLRQAALAFRDTYNTTSLVKRYGFTSHRGIFRQRPLPNQRRLQSSAPRTAGDLRARIRISGLGTLEVQL